jgi:anion-transporting  ArsA/GET3 family ATPase
MTAAILVTGAGGVGKTTVSAALGVTAARSGKRTLVLTVDPARRLASALGVGDQLGSEPQPHPEEPNLWAAMLDASLSWRSVATKHADPEVAERLVNNEFFLAASEHFPASQSYAAADQAATFVEAGAWDLVVIDTPPSAGGIDFFTAPAQMADLVGGRLLRWLTGGPLPGRFLYRRAGRPMLRIADSILGNDLLERVAEFLLDLRTTYDGVADRGRQIEALMGRATILVVTTADPAPITEAARFYRELPEVGGTPAAVIFNRTLPGEWIGFEPPGNVERELAENLARWGAESLRQSDARAEFAAVNRAEVATIPWMPEPPNDLDGLALLVERAGSLPSGLLEPT